MNGFMYNPDIEYQNKQIIEVNSRHITSGTPDNFYITIPNDLFTTRSPHFIKVVDANIPYSFFQIIDGVNNHFTLDDGGGVVDIYITEQHYSGVQLALEIKNELDAVSSIPQVYTVDYSKQTNKYTIHSTANFTLDFDFDDSIYKATGFLRQSYAGTNSYTSDTMIDLINDEFLWICTDLINGIDNGVMLYRPTTENMHILATIPITVDYGGMICYHEEIIEPPKDIRNARFSYNEDVTKSINIWLERESGLPMSLNGLNWSMKFILFY